MFYQSNLNFEGFRNIFEKCGGVRCEIFDTNSVCIFQWETVLRVFKTYT